jgi:type 1 glutamine amidotransferase
MRRLTQSGFLFALVSGFSACSNGGSGADSRIGAATPGDGTSAGVAIDDHSATSMGGVTMTPTGGTAPLAGQSAGDATADTGRGAGGAANVGGSPAAGRPGNDAGVAGNAGAGAGGASTSRPARVLLYSFSTLDIPSLPAQLDILEQKLEQWQFEVDRSVDPVVFTDESLAKYAAVGMINTCFSPFGADRSGEAEAQALQKFLQQGGGLFGTHCADVTFQSADPVHLYNRLMGGRASRENFEGESDCYKMGDHPTIAALPATFVYNGNLDDTDFLGTDASVLIRCKWRGGGQKDIAVSWLRSEGSGRVFFSSFAKVDADFANPTIGENHLLAGLAWVLGR